MLRPERIKKDRGKMEDKVWGEDCYTQPSLLPCPFFFMSFFSGWTEIERKGQARLIFLGGDFWGVCCSDFKKSTLILLTLSKTCFKESKCRCM